MTSEAERGRPRRVMTVAGVVAAAVTVALYSVEGPSGALGFAGGVLTGAGMLSALVFVLTRAVVRPARRPKSVWLLVVLHVAKFGLAAVFMYVVLILFAGSAAAFAIGYGYALLILVIEVSRRGAPAVGTQGRRDAR